MARFVFQFISARDGTRLRTGVFEPEKPSRRVCVLLGGHTEFIEKYLEVIGELNARGFVVATFDWRGQGGSARPLSNPLMSYVRDFAEYDSDLTAFMEQVVAPLSPAKPMVLAHSMGGHLALRALHDQPAMFRAAVLSAPMLGIATGGYPGVLARAVTALQCRLGNPKKFAWGMARRDPFLVDFAAQLCTTDKRRYARTQDILLSHPAIRLAGPSWGWINAAYRAMKTLTAKGYAEAIKVPALVVGAGHDRIVQVDAARGFTARLPQGRYVEIENSEHEILMEQDAIRALFWQEFDGFVGGL